MANHPYPDAPRLIAKARGGAKSYRENLVTGFSVLDRYKTLWRVLEYLDQEAPAQGPHDLLDRIERLLMAEGAENPQATNERIRALGIGFDHVLERGDGVLKDFCEADLPFAKMETAKHMLKGDLSTIKRQRSADHLGPGVRKAVAHVLRALRNSAVHTGAMTETPAEHAYPAGAELLDLLVCRFYADTAGYTPAAVLDAIGEFAGKQGRQRPSWGA